MACECTVRAVSCGVEPCGAPLCHTKMGCHVKRSHRSILGHPNRMLLLFSYCTAALSACSIHAVEFVKDRQLTLLVAQELQFSG